jgi:hypothetical protein
MWIILGNIALGQFSLSQEYVGKIALQASSTEVDSGKLSPKIEERIQIVKQPMRRLLQARRISTHFLLP